MRIHCGLVAMILIAAPCLEALARPDAPSPPNTAESTAPALDEFIVKVLKPNEQGTGAFITPDGWILTVAHAANYDPSLMKVEWKEKLYEVTHVYFSHANCFDLALVKIEAENTPSLQIATENPRVQETVLTSGFPRGAFRKSSGFVLRYAGGDRQTGHVMTSFVFDRGGSGSPLLNRSRKICGILTSAAFDYKNEPIADFWIPAQQIQQLIDEARDAGKLPADPWKIAQE